MDFRDLVYITKVADCGNITEAARQLFISQPSLSYIVSKVEQDLGVQLFDRRNYPLTLTYAGEKYVETAREILYLNDNMRRELLDIGLGEKGRIRFGIPPERSGYMLPRILPEFKKLFPKVDIQIYEAMSDDLVSALMKNEINFFVLPRDLKDLPAGLKTDLIYRERLHLVAFPGAVTEKDLTGPEHNRVTPEFLQAQPFIAQKKGHANRKRTDGIFKRLRINPQISIEVSSCISATQLAASGFGVTIVPQRALESLGGVHKFCCYHFSSDPELWNVNVVYKADSYLDRSERAFIELLKKSFADH
ncbi:MAG: LysR family transcriptional regulator [Clostridium sp.]|nr:LysR family transcriptional regulator [Clostridium sp.]